MELMGGDDAVLSARQSSHVGDSQWCHAEQKPAASTGAPFVAIARRRLPQST
jgi:hypothetical protein